MARLVESNGSCIEFQPRNQPRAVYFVSLCSLPSKYERLAS